FAQQTNSGRFTRDEFTVIPEMQLKVGYGLTPSLRTYVSYSLLYWSSVARPGDQVDRVVNPLQNVLLGGTGTLAPPARPAVPFNLSDLWAQGVSLGVEWAW